MAKASGGTKGISNAQRIYNVAQTHGVELQGVAESVARQYGARVTPINYKSVESIERKARNVGYDNITDAVRTTIVSSREQIASITEDLKRRGFTVKAQTPDRYDGYSGYISKVKFSDGTVGEIQVNTPRMIYAKEKPEVARKIIGNEAYSQIERETGLEGGRGHSLYEQIRVLDPATHANEIHRLREESDKYYSKFRG